MKRRPSSACLPAFRRATPPVPPAPFWLSPTATSRPERWRRGTAGELPVGDRRLDDHNLAASTAATPASGTARVLRLTTLWSAVATKVPGTALSRRSQRLQLVDARWVPKCRYSWTKSSSGRPAPSRRRTDDVRAASAASTKRFWRMSAILLRLSSPAGPAPAQAPPTPVPAHDSVGYWGSAGSGNLLTALGLLRIIGPECRT